MNKHLKKFDKEVGFPISTNNLVVEYLKKHYQEMEEEDIELDFQNSIEYENFYHDEESLQHNIETLACLWAGLISLPFESSFCSSDHFYILKVDYFSSTLNCYLNDEDKQQKRLTPLLLPSIVDLIAVNQQYTEMTFSYGDFQLNNSNQKIKSQLASFKTRFPLVYNYFLENYKKTFKDLISDTQNPTLFSYSRQYEIALYYAAEYFKKKPTTKTDIITKFENESVDLSNTPMVFLKIISSKKAPGNTTDIKKLKAVIENTDIKFYKEWLKKF